MARYAIGAFLGLVLIAQAQEKALDELDRGFESILFPLRFETTVSATPWSLLRPAHALEEELRLPEFLISPQIELDSVEFRDPTVPLRLGFLALPPMEQIFFHGNIRRFEIAEALLTAIGGASFVSFSNVEAGELQSSVFTTISLFNLGHH